MKNSVLTIAIALMSQFSLANTSAIEYGPVRNLVGQIFAVTSMFNQPLTTTEPCVGPNPAVNLSQAYENQIETRISFPGVQAYSQAASVAMAACRQSYGSTCYVLSAIYRDVQSQQFIGYKACEATVRVHGFRLN